MPNMRTEVWNVCSRFGGKYELDSRENKVVCKLRDGTLEYDLESGVLEGRFGEVTFSVTDIDRVHYGDSSVVFVDSRGTRVGLAFDHVVTVFNREPARVTSMVFSHPDPFWPGIRGAQVTVEF